MTTSDWPLPGLNIDGGKTRSVEPRERFQQETKRGENTPRAETAAAVLSCESLASTIAG